MAAKPSASLLSFFFLFLFFALVSACYTCPPEKKAPPPPPPPSSGSGALCPPPPPPKAKCPRDTLKLGVCVDVLNGLINVHLGKPPAEPCCSLLDGLADAEAAACLCTVLKANAAGLKLAIPVDVSLILNHCGKTAPKGFQC